MAAPHPAFGTGNSSCWTGEDYFAGSEVEGNACRDGAGPR